MANNPLNTAQVVADAERVDEFLRDPAIVRAMTDLETRYTMEMVNAKESSDMRFAQGKIHGLRDLAKEMAAIVGNGEHELLTNALNEKRREYLKKDGQVVQ